MRKFYTVLCVALVACAPVIIPQAQIMQMSDVRVCDLYNGGTRFDQNTQNAITAEINSRGIDCHPHNLLCQSFGYKPNTPDYAKCREEQYKLSVEQEEAEKNRQLMEQLHRERMDALERQRVEVYHHNIEKR